MSRRQAEREFQQSLSALALYLARELRSGATTEAALLDVISDLRRVPERVLAAKSQLAGGRPLPEVLEFWFAAARSRTEELLVAALQVGSLSGASVASAMEGVGSAIRDDIELDARRRTWLAQAQVSAAVLVALPVLFASVSSLARGRVLYEGSLGLTLLAAGLTLDGFGVFWIRRLLRSLR